MTPTRSPSSHRLRRLRRRGSAATEFALWMPLITLLFSGMVDFSWYMSRYHNIVRVARDAARVAVSTYENPVDDAAGSLMIPAAEAHAIKSLTMMGMPCLDCVTVTYSKVPFKHIKVEVQYDFEPLVGFYKWDGILYSKFVMHYEYQ